MMYRIHASKSAVSEPGRTGTHTSAFTASAVMYGSTTIDFTPRFDRASANPWPPCAAFDALGWLPHMTNTRSESSRRLPSSSALSTMPTKRSTLSMSTQQLKPTLVLEMKSRGMAHWHAPEASELQPPTV